MRWPIRRSPASFATRSRACWSRPISAASPQPAPPPRLISDIASEPGSPPTWRPPTPGRTRWSACSTWWSPRRPAVPPNPRPGHPRAGSGGPLRLELGLAQLIGAELELGCFLLALVRLAHGGTIDAIIAVHPTLQRLVAPLPAGARLARHFENGEFSGLRLVISRRVLTELDTPRRLHPGSAMGEIAAVRGLAVAMSRPVGPSYRQRGRRRGDLASLRAPGGAELRQHPAARAEWFGGRPGRSDDSARKRHRGRQQAPSPPLRRGRRPGSPSSNRTC